MSVWPKTFKNYEFLMIVPVKFPETGFSLSSPLGGSGGVGTARDDAVFGLHLVCGLSCSGVSLAIV